MRILVSIHHHLDRNSGAPGSSIALAETRIDLGHQATLYSFDDLPRSWSEQRKMLLFPEFLAAFLQRHRRDFDVVHSSTGDAWLWSLLRRRGTRPLLAVTSHGLEHLAHATILKEASEGRITLSRKYPLYHGGWRLREVEFSLRRADAVFFLNRGELRFAIDRFRLDPTRTFLSHNGLPDALIGLPAPKIGNHNPIRIAQIGTYIHTKGTLWGARALDQIMTEHRALTVTFLGTRWTVT